MCFYLRNWQVTFLLYTLGVFISEYTAKAFTEPRDYRVVFLIQSTPQKTLRGCITFLIVQLSAELKRNVNRDKSAVHTPCRVKLSYVPEVREMPTLSYLSIYGSYGHTPERIRSLSDASARCSTGILFRCTDSHRLPEYPHPHHHV